MVSPDIFTNGYYLIFNIAFPLGGVHGKMTKVSSGPGR